ncbi:RNA polymerase sigma factor [[Clostridium] fimetarium]|uniref:RNA polymerase sigma factor, sigma-70 family n=1 Tax=[Clostridium] fimetarium TaxID=99656 RepID=A0A1I0QVR2_9FIRM|nr:sigma-70 family RNA polymerase sigma factor [[Clostridium] fimetarium]SEW31766.1 RNA polymerase sigma factor, sigma-70 family [[Clostridium] fimetarium]
MITPEELQSAVAEYKSGKKEAFNQIYSISNRFLYKCIYNVMIKQNDVDDVVSDMMQETYIEISKSIHQLIDNKDFYSWASTIANRKCFAYLKKNKKIVLLHEDDTTFDMLADSDDIIPESIMQDKEKQRLLRDIINNELTEIQKLCVIGYYYNEQKQEEIATALELPLNTVKTNLSRAKAKIKEAVLKLEKNKGTKLYSVSPLLLLLFYEEVKACVVPDSISSAVNATSNTGNTIASETSKSIVKKVLGISLKAKIAIGIIGVSIICIVGYAFAVNKPNTQEVGVNNVMQNQAITETATTAIVQNETTWKTAYRDFLLYNTGGTPLGFDIKDFDDDSIPELLVKTADKNNVEHIKFYKYVNATVKNVMQFEDSYSETNSDTSNKKIYTKIGYGKDNNEFIVLQDWYVDYKVTTLQVTTAYKRIYVNGELVSEFDINPAFTFYPSTSKATADLHLTKYSNGKSQSVNASQVEIQSMLNDLQNSFTAINYSLINSNAINSKLSTFSN